MKTVQEIKQGLAQHYGTMAYHKFSIMFPNLVLTDGAKYLADSTGAYWLMNAIGSYQTECMKDKMLKDIQFWTFTVKDGIGTIKCERDTGNVAFTQEIPYTDFPLDEIKLYVENGVIMLPSER